MPIRPELRKFYRGPEYNARRARIKERAGNRCEQCKVKNHTDVDRCNGGWWLEIVFKPGLADAEIKWRDQHGHYAIPKGTPKVRRVRIKCGMAHLDHNPQNNADENLKWLCDWCHLNFDMAIHQAHARETRIKRKDSERPLLLASMEGVA